MTIEEWEILDLLTALVDKSLVIYEEDEHGMGRYRLLQTTRQYAHERLLESGEEEALRERHRDFFAQLAEEAEPQLTGAEQRVWLERLETEHDNLRAALERSRSAEQRAETGLRIAGAIWRFWYVRGHFTEGRRWFEGLLTVECGVRGAVRAKALNGVGMLAESQGDYGRAQALLEESLVLRRELGDKWGIAHSLNSLGVVALDQGDYGAAQALFEESLVLRRELGDKWGIAMTLTNLGNVAWSQGDCGAARALHEEGLAIRRELGDKWGIAHSLINLGGVAYSQSDYGAARRFQEECLSICQGIGDKRIMGYALNILGGVAYQQRDWAAAHAFYEESLTIGRDIGDKWGIAESLEGLAKVASGQGQWERAARLFGAAEALREAIGSPLLPVQRDEYDRQVAVVRAALGEEAFAAAWAEGRKVRMEEAVECALET